jgi:hypothetical protein
LEDITGGRELLLLYWEFHIDGNLVATALRVRIGKDSKCKWRNIYFVFILAAVHYADKYARIRALCPFLEHANSQNVMNF